MNKNIFLIIGLFLVTHVAHVQSAALGKELVKCGVSAVKDIGKEILPSIIPFGFGYTVADYLIMNEEDFSKEKNEKKYKEGHRENHTNCDDIFGCYKSNTKLGCAMISCFFLNFPSVAQYIILQHSFNYVGSKSQFLENCLLDFFLLPKRIFYQTTKDQDHFRELFNFLPKNFSAQRIKYVSYLTLLIITFGWQKFLLKQIFSLPDYIPYVPQITSWILKNSGISRVAEKMGITSFYQLDLSEYLTNKALKKWAERNKSKNA